MFIVGTGGVFFNSMFYQDPTLEGVEHPKKRRFEPGRTVEYLMKYLMTLIVIFELFTDAL